uniref:Secreted protein n=1 Tax=Ascaris lumbricoides TaxID=6252 RepID=A0A0M3HUV5_ASCLU
MYALWSNLCAPRINRCMPTSIIAGYSSLIDGTNDFYSVSSDGTSSKDRYLYLDVFYKFKVVRLVENTSSTYPPFKSSRP